MLYRWASDPFCKIEYIWNYPF